MWELKPSFRKEYITGVSSFRDGTRILILLVSLIYYYKILKMTTLKFRAKAYDKCIRLRLMMYVPADIKEASKI